MLRFRRFPSRALRRSYDGPLHPYHVSQRRAQSTVATAESWELLGQKRNDAAPERQHQCHFYEYRHKKLGTRVVHMKPIVKGDPIDTHELAHAMHTFHFGLSVRTPVLDERPLPFLTQHCIVEGCHTNLRNHGTSIDVFQQIQRRNTLNSIAQDAEHSLSITDTNAAFQFTTTSQKDLLNIADVATDAVLGAKITQEDFYRNLLRPTMSNEGNVVAFMDNTAEHLIMAQSSTQAILRAETTRHLFEGTSLENGSPLGTLEGLYHTRYEDLLGYHKKYYHPSNAMLFTYGSVEPEAILKHLDQTAFGALEQHVPNSDMYDEIGQAINQRVERWSEPHRIQITSQENEGFSSENQDSMVSFAFLTENEWQQDPVKRYAMFVLYEALRDPFGPFLQGLEKKLENLATFMDEIFTNRMNMPDDYLAFGFKSIHQDNIPEVESAVHDGLREIAEKGFPERYVQQLLNRHKITYKDPTETVTRIFEDMVTTWTRGSLTSVVDGVTLNSNLLFQRKNSPLHPSNFHHFVKETVRSLLVENNHRLTVVMLPEAESTESIQEKFETLGREYAESEADTLRTVMPRVQEQLIELSRLSDNQKTPYSELYDTEGIFTINDIPIQPSPSAFNSRLSVEQSDSNGEREIIFNEQSDSDGLVEIACQIFPRYSFRGSLRSFLPLIAKMMESVGARAMSNDDLMENMLKYTLGGISVKATTVKKPNGDITYGLAMSGKCNYTNIYKLMDLFTAMVSESEITREMDDSRHQEMVSDMVELIKAEAWEKQTLALESPTFYMSQHAASLMNKFSHNIDAFNGLMYMQFLHGVTKKIEEEPEEPKNMFEMIKNFLQSLYSANGGVKILVTSSSQHKETVVDAVDDFLSSCFSMQARIENADDLTLVEDEPFEPSSRLMYIPSPMSELVFILTQAIDTVPRTHDDAPVLLVTAFLLNSYFERTITRKGGAIITCLHDKSGAFITQSTNDKSPFETIHIIRDATEQWLSDEMFTEQELERAKFNAFKTLKMDEVRSAHSRAMGPLTMGESEKQEVQYRKALLATRSEDIARVAAAYLKDIMFEKHDPDTTHFDLQRQVNEKNEETMSKKGIDIKAELKKRQEAEGTLTSDDALETSAAAAVAEGNDDGNDDNSNKEFKRIGCMIMMGPTAEKLPDDIKNRLEQGEWMFHE